MISFKWIFFMDLLCLIKIGKSYKNSRNNAWRLYKKYGRSHDSYARKHFRATLYKYPDFKHLFPKR